MQQKISGAQALLRRLEQHGTKIIFGIPGGNILPVYHALVGTSMVHILAKHEQGAGFMAQGMARITGKPAVCMATSGPGVTNLITAISDAWSDSVPLIVITGQVPKALKGTSAFQEVDTPGMVSKITKKCFSIEHASQISEIVDEAFALALSGRPGPVWIDFPKDVQLEMGNFGTDFAMDKSEDNHLPLAKEQMDELVHMLDHARYPAIIAGHGVVISGAAGELQYFAEKQQIPVVTTLHGIGVMPPSHPLYFGMAGMHGSYAANQILVNSDLIFAFGIRFDDRLTGNIQQFCPSARIVHIDINACELNRLKAVSLAIESDLKPALKQIVAIPENQSRSRWIEMFNRFAEEEVKYGASSPGNPERIIREVSRLADPNAIVVTDVGQHQMWVAQNFRIHQPGHLLTSGGQGTMGFGLPAAIGASLAHPHSQVILWSGDGSILMNLQELATLAELNLNVKVLIMNNSALGMVRQQQQLFYHDNFSACQFGEGFNFSTIASAFGIRSHRILGQQFQMTHIQGLLSQVGPAVIDLVIDQEEMVSPIMEPGKSVQSMLDCRRVTEVSLG